MKKTTSSLLTTIIWSHWSPVTTSVLIAAMSWKWYLKQPIRYMVGILITKANMSSMKVLRAWEGCNHKISKVPLNVSMLSTLSSTKILYVKQVLMTFHLVCHHPPRKVSHALQLVVDEELHERAWLWCDIVLQNLSLKLIPFCKGKTIPEVSS